MAPVKCCGKYHPWLLDYLPFECTFKLSTFTGAHSEFMKSSTPRKLGRTLTPKIRHVKGTSNMSLLAFGGFANVIERFDCPREAF